jgi:hypothetical protein
MAFSMDQLESGDLRLTVGEDFSPEDAWKIHELLDRSNAGTHVQLDFRRVRDCHDFALSLLAHDIVAGRAVFDLHGLSQHQERVLSYFGVAPGAQESLADLDPI